MFGVFVFWCLKGDLFEYFNVFTAHFRIKHFFLPLVEDLLFASVQDHFGGLFANKVVGGSGLALSHFQHAVVISKTAFAECPFPPCSGVVRS